MARNRKRRTKPRAEHARDPRLQRVAPPKARLKPLFKLLDDVTTSADRALVSTEDAGNSLVRFDAEILVRGTNAVKAIRLLLENGHWEIASSATRQLFELVVNMEYLGTLPDREQATLRYTKFGLLQMLRHQQQTVLYDQRTGRETDPDRTAARESLLQHTFTEFRSPKPKADGSPNWAPSWASKNTRALANLSANPLRHDQYELLFTAWSEQTHATPGTLMDGLFRTADMDGLFRTADEDWVKKIIADDDRKIAEITTTTLAFFIELWSLLPNVTTLDPNEAANWMERSKDLFQQYAMPTPSRPADREDHGGLSDHAAN